MIAAIRGECRKYFSTRMWWILALGMFVLIFAFSGLIAGVFAWVARDAGAGNVTGGDDSLSQLLSMIYGFGPSMGYIFPAIIGAFAWTNEYRHRTLIPTFLAEPRRLVVTFAKAIAGLLMGFILGVIGTVGALGGGAIGFSLFGADPHLSDPGTWQTCGLSVLALTIWTLVGLGLGMLVTNQVAAIVTLIVWRQLIEALLMIGLTMVGGGAAKIIPYLPGSLSSSITGADIFSLATVNGESLGAGAVPVWESALLLAAYGVIFGAIGYAIHIRRDVK